MSNALVAICSKKRAKPGNTFHLGSVSSISLCSFDSFLVYISFPSSSSIILGSIMGEDGGGASDDYDPHGDPKADPRERRRIRYEYRELIAETQSKDNCFTFFAIFVSFLLLLNHLNTIRRNFFAVS